VAVLDRVTHITLEHVLRPVGPMASVYLGPSPEVTNEYRVSWDTRWRPLAATLRAQGAEDHTVHLLEGAVSGAAAARAARGSTQVGAFAQDGRVLAVVGLPGSTQPDQAQHAAPAHVVPMLAWAQERPAYVLVVADRAGADLEASIGAGATPVRLTVEGPDDEIERNAPGGWQGMTQGRYQRRAEDSWAHNAAAAADAAASALHRAEAKVLVVTGDVRAVQLLRGRLPTWVHQEVDVRLLTGSRAADGSQRARADAVAHVVREASRVAKTRVWQTFVEGRAPHGRAVAGVRPTLAALAEGRVSTLLVSPARVPIEARVWFGAAPTALQSERRPHPDWESAQLGSLLDVVVRSALLTGAKVEVLDEAVDHELVDGVGALCRFR
jgi:Bacterial archaeo-eukaryotic release factor family 2